MIYAELRHTWRTLLWPKPAPLAGAHAPCPGPCTRCQICLPSDDPPSTINSFEKPANGRSCTDVVQFTLTLSKTFSTMHITCVLELVHANSFGHAEVVSARLAGSLDACTRLLHNIRMCKACMHAGAQACECMACTRHANVHVHVQDVSSKTSGPRCSAVGCHNFPPSLRLCTCGTQNTLMLSVVTALPDSSRNHLQSSFLQLSTI